MKTCRTISVLLVGYAADELSEFERRRVDAHLAACDACRTELARERRLRAFMGSLARSEPPTVCPDRVTARITAAVNRDEQRRRVVAVLRSRYVAATVLAAAAVLLAVILPSRMQTPAPDAVATARTEVSAVPVVASRTDLDDTRRDVTRALVYTAAVIDRAERRVRDDVLRLLQPAIQAAGVFDTAPASPGGQG
ncbi:MAG: zf-HC2 domain-containing protein [Candidatus Krumholzibacteria bacterium]|jgi:anti-sigma factor RsiW|nr:zf-HC2 domain-containing protein [Candidatus Krumholzibacteria bacterium]